MKKIKFLYLVILIGIIGCQSAPVKKEKLVADNNFGVLKGDARADSVEIVVIPQWHMSPTTQKAEAQDVPQVQNQLAIYDQLVLWIDAGKMKTIVVEGCEGEIKKGFAQQFNGWQLSELEKTKELRPAMTHIGLKLEAKYGPKLQVICGDNLALVKKHQLAFSDLRGLLGFKVRINEFKTQPEKQTEYMNSLKQVLKLDDKTLPEDALKQLDKEIEKSLNDFKALIQQRNESLVAAIAKVEKPTAVVVGALHAEGIVSKLSEQEQPTLTFEPVGLKGDEKVLLDLVEKNLKSNL